MFQFVLILQVNTQVRSPMQSCNLQLFQVTTYKMNDTLLQTFKKALLLANQMQYTDYFV